MNDEWVRGAAQNTGWFQRNCYGIATVKYYILTGDMAAAWRPPPQKKKTIWMEKQERKNMLHCVAHCNCSSLGMPGVRQRLNSIYRCRTVPKRWSIGCRQSIPAIGLHWEVRVVFWKIMKILFESGYLRLEYNTEWMIMLWKVSSAALYANTKTKKNWDAGCSCTMATTATNDAVLTNLCWAKVIKLVREHESLSGKQAKQYIFCAENRIIIVWHIERVSELFNFSVFCNGMTAVTRTNGPLL